MEAIKAINLGLAFVLELVMIAALGYWGFQASDNILIRLLLGIGAPLIAILIWAKYNAPKSATRLQGWRRTVLELAIFAVAAVALVAAGQPGLAVAFMVIVIINQVLMYIWKQ